MHVHFLILVVNHDNQSLVLKTYVYIHNPDLLFFVIVQFIAVSHNSVTSIF